MGSSIGGSFLQNTHWTLQGLGGGVIGGTVGELTGGNFLDGFSGGIITAGLNHAMHSMMGPPRILFDGKYIYIIKGNKIIAKFPAVSGQPLSDGTFDYSVERQRMTNVGPIPEGDYTLNSNSTQKWSDLSTMQKIYALGLAGRFPGGTIAWGSERVDINPSNYNPFDVPQRSGFTIHGGSFPGSAGCIDLTIYDKPFFNKIRNTGILKLTVKY